MRCALILEKLPEPISSVGPRAAPAGAAACVREWGGKRQASIGSPPGRASGQTPIRRRSRSSEDKEEAGRGRRSLTPFIVEEKDFTVDSRVRDLAKVRARWRPETELLPPPRLSVSTMSRGSMLGSSVCLLHGEVCGKPQPGSF